MANISPPRRRRLIFPGLNFEDEKQTFVENLTDMLDSGIALASALDSLRRESHSSAMRRIVGWMVEDVESGLPLWQSVQSLNLFPSYLVSLLRIGEQSGTLTDNMKVIVLQQRKERTLRSKIRAAMAYPVLILVITIVVGTGISWFILPRLTHVFDSFNLNLPITTRLLIRFSNFLARSGAVAIPSTVGGGILLIYVVFVARPTRWIGEAFLFRVPMLSGVIQDTQVARMTFLLGTLLRAGVPIDDALGAVSNATTWYNYRRFVGHLNESIAGGSTFEQAFASFRGINRVMRPTTRQMLEAAEKTGRLPETLMRISEAYGERIDTSSKNLSTALEPILLFVVWIGVVFVALAIILPIYSLIGGISGSISATPGPTLATPVSSPQPVVVTTPTATLTPIPTASPETDFDQSIPLPTPTPPAETNTTLAPSPTPVVAIPDQTLSRAGL